MTHSELLAHLRSLHFACELPVSEWFEAHLAQQRALFGDKTAFDRFSYVMRIISDKFGPQHTAALARLMRTARVTPKVQRQSEWDKAEQAVARLPAAWQAKMHAFLQASMQKKPGKIIWSASYTSAVAAALSRWHTYCSQMSVDTIPTGSSLDAYASVLIDGLPGQPNKAVTVGTAHNYIERILAGMQIVHPGYKSVGADFVLRDYKAKAKTIRATTKQGARLVGARVIYNLGFELMDQARTSKPRGARAALHFRNGLMLAIGVALPERARALSSLSFGTSIWVEDDRVHVNIEGRFLKQRETEKPQGGYQSCFRNPVLAQAILEYMQTYRPIFDDGACLFPSLHSNRAISEQQIGALSRSLTKKHLGVAITVHHLRDNVATEASEHLGPVAATTLLRHRNHSTTQTHYDHSEGLVATDAYGKFLEKNRREVTHLAL